MRAPSIVSVRRTPGVALMRGITESGTPLAKDRAMAGPLQMAATEVRFYRGPRAELGIAPTPYQTSIGSGARFLLLLEDLIGRGCELYSLHHDVGLEHLEAMMEVFGELHGRFWQSPRFESDLA